MTVTTYKARSGLVLDAGSGALLLKDCHGVRIGGGPYRAEGWSGAIYLDGCSDVVLDGVIVENGAGDGRGLTILGSRGVTLVRARITGGAKGVIVQESRDVLVSASALLNFGIDGIDVNSSQNVEISDCAFAGGLVAGKGDPDAPHPDCVQIWSTPGKPLASDVRILRNLCHGDVQGANCYGKPLGAEKITIEDNVYALSRPNAIYLAKAPGSAVRRNVIRSLPGSAHKCRPVLEAGIVDEGNVVAAFARQ